MKNLVLNYFWRNNYKHSPDAYLFSEEVNYQPCSIEYEDNCIYFNMYHGICGGCGTFLWVKTTVYEYICANYGVHPEPGTTIMADTPVSEEEYAYETLRRFYDYTDVVDGVKGLKNKMFEILGVGDFLFQQKCEDRINKMINDDTTVIIVSHSIEQIERLCKHCVWLEKGKIKMIGDAAEVCNAYKNSQR